MPPSLWIYAISPTVAGVLTLAGVALGARQSRKTVERTLQDAQDARREAAEAAVADRFLDVRRQAYGRMIDMALARQRGIVTGEPDSVSLGALEDFYAAVTQTSLVASPEVHAALQDVIVTDMATVHRFVNAARADLGVPGELTPGWSKPSAT